MGRTRGEGRKERVRQAKFSQEELRRRMWTYGNRNRSYQPQVSGELPGVWNMACKVQL